MMTTTVLHWPGRAARAATLPLLLTFAACDSPNEPAPVPPPARPPTVASIDVGPQPGPLLVGGTVQFSATPRDAAGRPLGRAVIWATEDTVLATISASGLLVARRAGVTRVTATSGGFAVTVSIDIRNVTPVLTHLVPASVEVGSGDLTLSVHGTGFAPGAIVYWNGQPRPTTRISPTEVTIQLARLDLYLEGMRAVHVVNPDGMTEKRSGTLPFSITPAQPVRAEYRLVGLETRRWPTTRVADTTWTDEDGTAHPAVLYVTGGALTITYQTGRDTRWELRLHTETHVVDRLDPVRTTTTIDGGLVFYDVFNGQMMLRSTIHLVTWLTRAIGEELKSFVMQHRIAGTELPWLFERVE